MRGGKDLGTASGNDLPSLCRTAAEDVPLESITSLHPKKLRSTLKGELKLFLVKFLYEERTRRGTIRGPFLFLGI